ncbi:hypothetical protein [Dyella tabacisoli]|uniref:DUF3298 domain-containing protein n=1 Tax=Dyella tabacisoli TaxID=2282381 RepID=A0A369UMX9_9GAMM|nr:hypothetical protein [Dyella tabacisoli]RDD81966.1 hypothetical protein DVJ77_09245 [Dyella tabacisoli]
MLPHLRWFAISPLIGLLWCAAMATEVPASAGSTLGHTEGRIDDRPYTIDIKQAALEPAWSKLKQAIDDYAAMQRSEFLGEVKQAPKQHSSGPWALEMEFSIAAQTRRFITVVVFGDAEVGNAHPTPITNSFSYDLPKQQMLALPDLFTDFSAAEAALADKARAQLMAQLRPGRHRRALASNPALIRQGTQIGKDRFHLFAPIVHKDHLAHGISLIFPPGQVTSPAAGPQSVDVPTSVFARWLKPEYRDAFH